MRLAPNPHPLGSDEYYIFEALQLAHAGLGWAAPNPLVGAVLVREGQVIGRGAHLRDGEEHAETLAVRAAGDARGATCYVNLEPCTHVGRQPSCCHELAQAGVTRVVYGAQDGDPRTAGQADGVLAGLGIACTPGVLKGECADFLDYYLYGYCMQRAFIHLKLALSLDAKVACANGHSQWLSGPESLGYAHYLRQKYDAVLVGYRTVQADDPRLTVRPDVLGAYRDLTAGTKPRNPVRVVLDPRFELLARLQLLKLSNVDGCWRGDLPRIVIAGWREYYPEQEPGIPGLVLLAPATTSTGELSFTDLARQLYGLGIRSLLIEGGAGVAKSALRQRAVDKLSLVYTPTLIGAEGLGFTPELGSTAVATCPRLERPRAEALGRDCLLSGYPLWPAEQT
jgi:diaminohydroxyphosphoribosylaminopyrimidine deaminase/5-amino-6-(5-phosphoribosylamino)uracil reductase